MTEPFQFCSLGHKNSRSERNFDNAFEKGVELGEEACSMEIRFPSTILLAVISGRLTRRRNDPLLFIVPSESSYFDKISATRRPFTTAIDSFSIGRCSLSGIVSMSTAVALDIKTAVNRRVLLRTSRGESSLKRSSRRASGRFSTSIALVHRPNFPAERSDMETAGVFPKNSRP